MDDKTFQVVDMRLSICIFDSKLLWEWDPIIKFLLHESLWVDSESLKVNEKNFWIVANDYLFGCYLTCHASFTHQFVVLIEQLFRRKARHAVQK